MTFSGDKNTYVYYSGLLLVALGVLVRFLVYFQNRDLFIDELNLSRNLVGKSYSDLFGALDFQQHAPPLFTSNVKFVVENLSINSYCLRLIPLLAGIGSLYLFYLLARRFVKGWSFVYTLILFSLSMYLVEYSTEVKQYSTDVFLTLLFVLWTINLKSKSLKDVLPFGVVAAIFIWYSMPLIFILAATILYLLGINLDPIKNRNYQKLYPIIVIGSIFLLSFAGLYFSVLNASVGSEHLSSYHDQYFLPFPNSLANLKLFAENIISVMRSIVGKTTVPIVTGFFLFAFGVRKLIRSRISEGIVLLAPIAFCLFAAMLSMYSLIIRLTLFMLPLIMITMGLGLENVLKTISKFKRKSRLAMQLLLMALLMLTLTNRSAITYFIEPLQKAQVVEVLNQIKASKLEIPIYIYHLSDPAFNYYTEMNEPKIEIPYSETYVASWNSNLSDKIEEWRSQGVMKAWVFASHIDRASMKSIKTEIQNAGQIIEQHEDVATLGTLIKL